MKTIDKLAVIINNVNYAYDADVTVSGIRKLVEFAERYGMDEVAIATDICIKNTKLTNFSIGSAVYYTTVRSRQET